MKKVFLLCTVFGLFIVALFFFSGGFKNPPIEDKAKEPQANTADMNRSQPESDSVDSSVALESSQPDLGAKDNSDSATSLQPAPITQNSAGDAESPGEASTMLEPPETDLYFSVQTGSFRRRQNAVLEYKRLTRLLDSETVKTLRIERIGPYHAVRFGRFSIYSQAQQLLDRVKDRRPSAIILQAYIIESRTILSYPDQVPESLPSSPETSPQAKLNEPKTPPLTIEPQKERETSLVFQEPLPPPAESTAGTPLTQPPLTVQTEPAAPSRTVESPDIHPAEEATFLSQEEHSPAEIIEESPQDKESKETKTEIPEMGVEPIIALTKDDQGKELRMPTAIFYDAKNTELYVVNGSANRIVVFGSDYFPESSLGEGRGVYAPTSGTIGPNGSIYICQMNRGQKKPRISIYNAAFFPANEIEIDYADESLKDFTPDKIAVDPQGRIYLTGLNSQALLILDPNKKQHKILLFYADRKGNFLGFSPPADDNLTPVFLRDIFIDSKGHIFVLSEQAGKIYTLNAKHEFLFDFGTKGGSAGKLSRPKALTVDEKGHWVYVVDYMRHTIVVYDLKGNFRYEIGGRGTGLGWFNYPVDVEIGNQGQLIVADYFNHRIQALKVTFRETFPPPPPEVWQTGTSG